MDIQNQDREYWSNLIMDSLTGNISPEGQSELDRWRSSSEENDGYFEEMHKLWHSLQISRHNADFNGEKAYRLFTEKAVIPLQKRRIPISRIMKYAAILIPFLFLGYFTIRYFSVSGLGKVMQMTEVTAPNGSKTQMKLPDGTTIWLNAGSRVEYGAQFGIKDRTVSLSGEAYFEVTGNKKHPFVVNAGNIKVKVLGTRFSINAYDNNHKIKVALMQGAVEVTGENNEKFILEPEEIAEYDVVSRKTSVLQNAVTHALDWMDDRLVFEGETFEHIVKTLERHYDVKINIHNDPLKTRQFAGDFIKNESLDNIFAVMSVNGNFNYEIKENVVNIW